MKRILLVATLFIASAVALQGQSVEQYSMYLQNPYLFNPAAAGVNDYLDMSFGFRRQWAGIKDAPQSFYATAHAPLNRVKTYDRSALRISRTRKMSVYNKKKGFNGLKHAIGGQLIANRVGAFDGYQGMLTYAIHLPLTKKMSLSMGLSAGIKNVSLNQDKIFLIDEGDPLYNSYLMGETSVNEFNANAGAYLYSDKFFFGYSAYQLLENELGFAVGGASSASLSMNHFVMGGYHFPLTRDLLLTPSFLLKYQDPNPISLDISGKVSYKDNFWFALSYRNQDAIIGMLGMNITDLIKFGYAYDFTTSELNERANGSHEIMIGLTPFR